MSGAKFHESFYIACHVCGENGAGYDDYSFVYCGECGKITCEECAEEFATLNQEDLQAGIAFDDCDVLKSNPVCQKCQENEKFLNTEERMKQAKIKEQIKYLHQGEGYVSIYEVVPGCGYTEIKDGADIVTEFVKYFGVTQEQAEKVLEPYLLYIGGDSDRDEYYFERNSLISAFVSLLPVKIKK